MEDDGAVVSDVIVGDEAVEKAAFPGMGGGRVRVIDDPPAVHVFGCESLSAL
jgi:hypothetical protein